MQELRTKFTDPVLLQKLLLLLVLVLLLVVLVLEAQETTTLFLDLFLFLLLGRSTIPDTFLSHFGFFLLKRAERAVHSECLSAGTERAESR